MKKNSLVCTIWMVTYNHKDYIEQAISSVLAQKTNFKYKIFISDDKSTDGTTVICQSFALRFPEQIELVVNLENIGATQNGVNTYERCFNSGAKYIALLEGDDYWTDENKLQKQVDFLEANEDYVICFSGYKIVNEFKKEETIVDTIGGSFSIEDILKGNSFSTATVVYESKYFNPVPAWVNKVHFGDWAIYLLGLFNSKKGAFCLSDITAVYRIHTGGIHGNLHASNASLAKAYKMHIEFYRDIKKYLFKESLGSLVEECIDERIRIIAGLIENEKTPLPSVFRKWYDYFRYPNQLNK